VLALCCALLAGACGGEERTQAPQLPGALAERLAARSDTVADRLDGGDSCAARAEAEALQAETIQAVNDRRVPPRFQEELLASVTALLDEIECVQAPAPDDAGESDAGGDDTVEDDTVEEEPNGNGKAKGKAGGKKKGKGKKK
jgi:hypothetical protein